MSEVAVILNDPRTELRRTGWSSLRVGAAFRAAALTSRQGADGVCRPTFTPADFPHEVWQEPDTGYLMLRPSPLRDDFNDIFPLARIPLANLFVPPDWTSGTQSGAWFDEPANPMTGKPKMIACHKPDTTTAIPTLAGVPQLWLDAMAANSFALGIKAATASPLAVNEGFAITLLPEGIATDRAGAWFGVGFGGRFYLQIGMNGMAALYEYGTPSCQDQATWIRRARFEFAQGQADKEPFQVSVIPWGQDSLTFLFSQAKQSNRPTRHNTGKAILHSFTYHTSDSTGALPRYDDTLQHYVKLEPSNLFFAMRHVDYQYAFALSRVRYLATSFALLPEILDEPKPTADPFVDPIGFRPAGSTATATVLNQDGTAWDRTTGFRFSPQLAMTPSASAVYTPEVWALEHTIPPEVFTSADQSNDFSQNWSSLTWRETTHPDSSDIKVVVRRDRDYAALLKRDGCLRIDIDGAARVHAYFREQQPHWDGYKPDMLRDQWVLDDAWDRLNGVTIAFFKSFTKLSIGALLTQLFYYAGYQDADIDIDPILMAIEISGFEKESDWKLPAEEVTVGDLVRELIKVYGLQGQDTLRVRRQLGKWKCYLAPLFIGAGDAATTPDVIFTMGSDLMGVRDMKDRDRFLLDPLVLKVLTHPEFSIRRPSFNAGSFFGVDDPSEQAGLLAAFIAPDPATLDDPLAVDFNQRVRHKTFGPQEMGHISTQNGLERRARKMYDEENRKTRVVTFAGEWQPAVTPDQFAWLVGYAPGINPVSYGLWRIEEAEITLEHDLGLVAGDDKWFGSNNQLDRRWTWGADYVLTFAGAYEEDGFPMFSTTVPTL